MVYIPFTSRSALSTEPLKKKKVRHPERTVIPAQKPCVFIVGQVLPLSSLILGKSLGFNVVIYEHDLSWLVGIKHLIVNNIANKQFFRLTTVFNFCLSWNIPMTWIHPYVKPVSWICQFDNIFVGDFPDERIWRAICRTSL